jgi:tetratricopeptide (TPR) repeat protein
MGWKKLLIPGVLALAVLTVYGSSLRNDFVIWDDDSLVYRNPLVQEMTPATVYGAFSSYDPELYVPLTIVSFQIEHALFGFNPFFFHLDNVLLHIIAACLVFFFLERLGLKRMTALLCALIFAVHPLNTETAVWVSARKDLLSMIFCLSALLTYRRNTWWTLTFFVLALLSKPIAIVLPIAFLLIDWKNNVVILSSTKDDRYKSWFVGLTMTLLSVLFFVIGIFGKTRNIAALTAVQTLLLGLKSAAFSLLKLFWPTGLSPIYLQTSPVALQQMEFWLPLLLLLLLAATVLWSLRYTKVIFFCACFYLLFLIPSFSNFAKGSDTYFFSDRYVYISQIGLLFLLGFGIDRIARTIELRIVAWVLATPLVLTFGYLAHAQALLWKDSETLYRDALTKNERSVIMHYNLALLEQQRGNLVDARTEYDKTLALDPLYAKAIGNLGMLENAEGHPDKAIEYFHRAMAADPRLPEPHNNLGSVLMDQGKVDEAIVEFRAAIALNERFAQAYINLAAALGRKGLYEEGLDAYRKAFEYDSSFAAQFPEIVRALENLK